MSEELLSLIIQLFSIVAKERITEDERSNIKEFLSFHLNQESIPHYLQLFDKYCEEYKPQIEEIEDADQETIEFVDDWAQISEIGKHINKGLAQQQKLILILKIIELVLADGEISERQNNLIFYIGEIIKVNQKDIWQIEKFVRATDAEEFDSKNILIIDDGTGEHPYKSKRIAAKNLTGLIAILRIPGTATYFVKYLGISDLSLNGVPLKSRQISVFPTGSTIRGNKISPVYYSDVVGRFIEEDASSKFSFLADHISYRFRSGDTGLRDIYISEEGGKMIGIMGASGSGKSTLLNVLNGSEPPSAGKVLINGINIHRDAEKIEGVIGFVPQEDFLIEELTVYQNLYYAARLCFGKYSKGQIHDLVISKLKILGLLETKDMKVGSPLKKIISGGQRKRLNIGLELLREPSVLFIDEPTSGLSSRDSENIMDLLKELTFRGKMIFVVIHQPSSDIYKMFDSMIILDVGGYQIYYGNPLEALVYFKTRVNMVNKDRSACIECGNVNAEQIFTIIENKVVNEFGRFTDQRKITPHQWNTHFTDTIALPSPKSIKSTLKSALQLPGKLNQIKIFAQRDILSKIGNKQYLIITFLEAPLLALFLSYLIRYYVKDGGGANVYVFIQNDNIPVYFFMSIIVAIFMGLTVSAEEILRDRKILKRESFLHLSKWSYLLAKTGVLFGISAVQAFTFVLIGNSILELQDMYFSLWLILFSCSCFANITGLNISSAFDSAVTIYILIPLLVIPQLILSGVVIKFDKFNPSVSVIDKVPWFGEIMASRWGFEASLVNQFKDNRYESQFYMVNKKMKQAEFKKTYFLPKLETKLSYVVNNYLSEEDKIKIKIKKELKLLRNELGKETFNVGKEQFKSINLLNVNDFTPKVYDSTLTFINKLKNYYNAKYKRFADSRDSLVSQMRDTPAKKEKFEQLRKAYKNNAISAEVTNANSLIKIVESQDRLIQKIYPIYSDPQPRNFMDFRATFYSPVKHFMGYYFDTVWFNIMVIWIMTIVLWITLYFDLIRKAVKAFGKSYRVKLPVRF